MALLRRGVSGEPVRILQEKLGVYADGIFGQATYNALIQYQTDNGLSADGIAGPDTFTAMELPELVLLHKPLRGQQVKRLQEGLGLAADGVFGNGTEAAVKRVQEENGLEVDGIAGPQTLQFIPGFQIDESQVNRSLVSDETPQVDMTAAEAAAAEIHATAPITEEESTISKIADAVTAPYRSIWSTVKSIF